MIKNAVLGQVIGLDLTQRKIIYLFDINLRSFALSFSLLRFQVACDERMAL